MLEADAVDPILVFREPATADEILAAYRLLGGDPGPDPTLRVFVLIDIEVPAPSSAVAAVEISPSQLSWRILRASGNTRHHSRLAAEVVRAATRAGASSLTVAPGAAAEVTQLMGNLGERMRNVGGWVSVAL